MTPTEISLSLAGMLLAISEGRGSLPAYHRMASDPAVPIESIHRAWDLFQLLRKAG